VQLLRKRSKQFGMDATYNVSANYTECERELEKEKMLENKKEIEYPEVKPFSEMDWNYEDIFGVESVKYTPFKILLHMRLYQRFPI
jgi:hypothetical protein